MRQTSLACLLVLPLAACVSSGGPGLEPIPGSLTYGGAQPTSAGRDAPAGSTFSHRIPGAASAGYEETYRVREDGSVELIRRRELIDLRR